MTLSNTRTIVGPVTNPPDGYVLTYSNIDGYYVGKPLPQPLLSIASPNTSPFNATTQEAVLVQSHTGVFTVNLPVSPTAGKIIYIKDFGGVAAVHNISVVSGQLIDGAGNYTINTNFGCVKVLFDGTTWSILTKF